MHTPVELDCAGTSPATEKVVHTQSTTSRILSALRELISAIDRRVPHPERPGEIRIARDARKLRREAVARIDSLTRLDVDGRRFDQELAEAIMTDDGGRDGRDPATERTA